MSRLTLLEGLLLNLKGEIEPRRREYLPKKEAYQQLKLHTGQDFGDDVDRWQQWIQNHPRSVRAKDASADASRMVSDFLHRRP